MTDRPVPGAPVFEQPDFGSTENDELLDDEDDEFDDEFDGTDDDDVDVEGDDDTDEGGDISDDGPQRGGVNQVPGGRAREVLEHIARSVVDDPSAVSVDVSPARSGVKLSLHVAPSDMGRIIGRRGRVAQALRSVVRAAAAKDGSDAVVDIVD